MAKNHCPKLTRDDAINYVVKSVLRTVKSGIEFELGFLTDKQVVQREEKELALVNELIKVMEKETTK